MRGDTLKKGKTEYQSKYNAYHHLFARTFRFLFQKGLSYQKGPGWFVVAVTHTPGFGLLHFMTVDPTPQFMGQPAQVKICWFYI